MADLAAILEDDPNIRQRARDKKLILRWPSKERTGIPSIEACTVNVGPMILVCGWWCALQPTPDIIPVGILRREVGL